MRIPTFHSAGLVAIGFGLTAATTAFGGHTPPGGDRIESANRNLAAHSWEEDTPWLIEDPVKFFDRLVDRYRELKNCREDVRVERVTIDPESEDPPLKSVVRVVAEVRDDQLTVRSSDLLDEVLDLVGAAEDQRSDGALESDLRLLPHLRLRFREDPLEGFVGGEVDDLRPAELDRVMVEDRELLRVELRSGESGASDTTFSLFVDPESMLVERIEGEAWLPGGLHHQTTVQVEARELQDPVPSREQMPEPDPASIDDSASPTTSNARMRSSV